MQYILHIFCFSLMILSKIPDSKFNVMYFPLHSFVTLFVSPDFFFTYIIFRNVFKTKINYVFYFKGENILEI